MPRKNPKKKPVRKSSKSARVSEAAVSSGRESEMRPLTSKEIDGVLSFIEPPRDIPRSAALAIANRSKQRLRKQLVELQVYPEIIPQLAEEIREMYESSQITPGECVGILAGQNIGERYTQGNLNKFHTAGSGDNEVNTVSTFAELLNTTKSKASKALSSMVYLRSGNTSIEEVRRTLGSTLVELTVAKIAQDHDEHESFEYCANKADEPWYRAFELLYSDDFRRYSDCISIHVNMELLYMYKLTLEQVAAVISSEFDDLAVVFSPDQYARLDVFVDTSSIDLPANPAIVVGEDNPILVYLEEVSIPLRAVHVAGIPGITNMFFVRDEEKSQMESEESKAVWAVETHGSNFQAILGHPETDATRCITRNVWDVYKTLGVEAARSFMIEEFSKLMGGINAANVKLLVDRMTITGTIRSMSRYTMRKDDSGILAKASFEELIRNALKGGAFCATDHTDGVSASIICGKQMVIGTGICGIELDLDALGVPPREV